MYAPSYGYAPGNASAPFTPNGVSPGPQPHNPHQQQPSQLQQPQHMMYNPQQYAAAGGQQSPYGSSATGMGGNAGAMGVMPNNGMAQMAGGHGMLHIETTHSRPLPFKLSSIIRFLLHLCIDNSGEPRAGIEVEHSRCCQHRV
jgi:hypothetical protein